MKRLYATILMLLLATPAWGQLIGPPVAGTGATGPTGPTGPAGPAPTGNAPQVVGYSAANTVEAETVTGDCVFARTGANAYSITCASVNSNTFPASFTTGMVLYASGANAISGLADAALGQVLISGGAGVAPSYSANPLINALNFAGGASTTAGDIAGTSPISFPSAPDGNAVQVYFGKASTTTGGSCARTSAGTGAWCFRNNGGSGSGVAVIGTLGGSNYLLSTLSLTMGNGINLTSSGGTIPTLTAGCNGAGSSFTAGSTNTSGQITTQTAASTTCTITFSASGAWTNAPTCLFTDGNANAVPVAFSTGATSTSTVVVDYASLAVATKINYICVGH